MTNLHEPSTTTPDRGFPESEFRTRTSAAQARLNERGIAALFLTTEHDIRYFSGFHTPFWQSPTRPWFLVVPNSGDPIAVVPSIGESAFRSSWLSDVRTWPAPRPADDGISLLTEVLAEVTRDRTAVIGVPMGHETHLRMPLANWYDLQRRSGGLRWDDATDIVRGLRMVKSPREVEKTAHICRIVSEAFAELPNLLDVGITEREAFRRFRIDILQRGADEVPYLVGGSGTHFDDIIKYPSDRVIAPGDLLMFDTGSMWDGYSSDFDRFFAFGHVDAAAARAHHVVWDATEAGLAMLRPGVTTSDLWRTMAEVMSAGGSLGSGVGRLGHGLGMQLTEWPSNTADDNTVIEEGMVLTLEPGMTFAPGRVMLHEENVVIRSNGPELLSRRASRDIPIIG